jgi:amino-acid N-acetyltransferase
MPEVLIEPAGEADTTAIYEFLQKSGLPVDGLRSHLATTLVARREGCIVGTVALEVYPDGGLLRSVAVDASLRGHGLGHRLIEAAIGHAQARGLPALYLLTTTAEAFFPRFGFVRVARDQVPASVRQSEEFTTACPASAVVMCRTIEAPEA